MCMWLIHFPCDHKTCQGYKKVAAIKCKMEGIHILHGSSMKLVKNVIICKKKKKKKTFKSSLTTGMENIKGLYFNSIDLIQLNADLQNCLKLGPRSNLVTSKGNCKFR